MVVAVATSGAPTGISIGRLLPRELALPEPLTGYRQAGGYTRLPRDYAPEWLRAMAAESGLRGRGGSGFPAGRKWESVAAQPGRRSVLVNAAESEPASAKDRVLLTSRPHLVIEGALLAARAIAAGEVIFYLHDGARDTRSAVEEAMRELRVARIDVPRWRIVTAPSRYVAGEETAAVQRANGKPAKPTFKPPRPFERGVRGGPTLVQNVETLANVPLIVRNGPDWFREAGTDDLPGTLLVTLSGGVRRPGVYETVAGTRLEDIIETLGGGTVDGQPPQAVLPGGYFSGWVGGDAIRRGVRLDRASLAEQGALLGSGAITVVPRSVCGLWQAVYLLRFFADESARQCGPCTFGTVAMADALERIAVGQPEPDDLRRLEHYASTVLPGRGACGHLDGATIAARTTLEVFRDDIHRHLTRGHCGRAAHCILPGVRGASDGPR